MSEQAPLLVEIDDHVMTLRINRPHDKNKMDRHCADALAAAFRRADADPEIRVVVITGDRDYFSTGGRVDTRASKEEQDEYVRATAESQQAAEALTKPMVAVVEGDCTAGGHNLVIQSDIAIARRGVSFGFPEINRGGFPMFSMLNVMDTIPGKKLLHAMYTGEPYSAEEAERFGLLSMVVDDKDFWPTVNAVVGKLKSNPPDLMQVGRKAYYAMMPMNAEERKAYAKAALVDVLAIQSRYQKEAE